MRATVAGRRSQYAKFLEDNGYDLLAALKEAGYFLKLESCEQGNCPAGECPTCDDNRQAEEFEALAQQLEQMLASWVPASWLPEH
ncbi:hypothetical protein ACQPW1_10285 [Nocardia sp. CA-128927]|uniref:hypothetical protein n=1 Tax=Nocardia sp. CA-128927 TaxID=3239975 RepID=UPI003D97C4B2